MRPAERFDSFVILILAEVGNRGKGRASRWPKIGNSVAHEREIKLKIEDRKAFRKLLKKLGAQPVGDLDLAHGPAEVLIGAPGGPCQGQLIQHATSVIQPLTRIVHPGDYFIQSGTYGDAHSDRNHRKSVPGGFVACWRRAVAPA